MAAQAVHAMQVGAKCRVFDLPSVEIAFVESYNLAVFAFITQAKQLGANSMNVISDFRPDHIRQFDSPHETKLAPGQKLFLLRQG
ncbi:MAG TPA: hypothetical protein VJB57_19950 [Dehalococcoidia bacterium]|nr:hypothetical protein [Dehalococcoidia bacterium]